MFRKTIGGLALLVMFLLPAKAAPDTACDLSNVVAGFWCERDGRLLLEKELVSGVTYYACPDCGEIRREPGTCEWCEVELEKKVSEKGVCPDCLKKPAAAEICTKVYYECPDCGSTSRKAGNCPDCETARAEKTSRAKVEYVCEKCGGTSLVPAKCANEDCEACGQPMKRTCSESGRFPHTKD